MVGRIPDQHDNPAHPQKSEQRLGNVFPGDRAKARECRQCRQRSSGDKNPISSRVVNGVTQKPKRPLRKNDLLAELPAGGNRIMHQQHPGKIERPNRLFAGRLPGNKKRKDEQGRQGIDYSSDPSRRRMRHGS